MVVDCLSGGDSGDVLDRLAEAGSRVGQPEPDAKATSSGVGANHPHHGRHRQDGRIPSGPMVALAPPGTDAGLAWTEIQAFTSVITASRMLYATRRRDSRIHGLSAKGYGPSAGTTREAE